MPLRSGTDSSSPGSLDPANSRVPSKQLLGFFSNGLTHWMPSHALVLESLKEKDSETCFQIFPWSSGTRSEFGSKQEAMARENTKQLLAV